MPIRITITDASCEVLKQDTETVTLKDGTQKDIQLEPFGVAVALGDYAIRSAPGPDYNGDVLSLPIIGYREDDYKAALQANIQGAVGKDFAPVIAGLALETAKGEATKAEAATLMAAATDAVAAARVQGQAIIDDATSQAAKIIDAAKAAGATDVQPEPSPVVLVR